MDSLRSMEANGIITRTVYPEVPPRVEYALSDSGESMRPNIKSMKRGGLDYKNRGNKKQQDCRIALAGLLFFAFYIIPKCCNASMIAFSFSGGHCGCLASSFLDRL